MKNNSNKNFLGYVAIVVALAMVVTTSVSLFQMNATAGAEAVTIAENATVVTSPFTEAVAKVRSSVVGVNNYTTYRSNKNSYNYYYGYGYGFGNDGGQQQPEEDTTRQVLQGSGSGVVVADGYVLTNYHVVEDATTLEVSVGDQVFEAQLMGIDANKDIAVLKVDGLTLSPVVLGDSDVLNVGDWAICIGNPLDFSATTTVGVISALNREIASSSADAYGKRSTNTMIQTDAAINSGNSGGGMFNVAGELVGIPSIKYTGSAFSGSSVEGIGMAIPINEAKSLINDVLSGNGNVQVVAEEEETPTTAESAEAATVKPRVGVTVGDVGATKFSAAVSSGLLPTGAYVSEVESGSPAEMGGVQAGDIIVDVDGTVITSVTQMKSMLQAKQANDTVEMKVYRVEGGLNNADENATIPIGEYVDLTVGLAILDAVQQ
ncbi:MAG: PDZ domain-containing protein [Clostridiales bacterium]|nr:PDZ domain-containing protein [Clostridiales bacterium]